MAKFDIFNVTKVFFGQSPESTNCIACTEDGRYLSLGHSGGLSVWCASSFVRIAEWLQDRLEITFLQTTRMAKRTYLLGSVDDMGLWNLSVFNIQKFGVT